MKYGDEKKRKENENIFGGGELNGDEKTQKPYAKRVRVKYDAITVADITENVFFRRDGQRPGVGKQEPWYKFVRPAFGP